MDHKISPIDINFVKTWTREGSLDNGHSNLPRVFERFVVPSQPLDRMLLSISCKMHLASHQVHVTGFAWFMETLESHGFVIL